MSLGKLTFYRTSDEKVLNFLVILLGEYVLGVLVLEFLPRFFPYGKIWLFPVLNFHTCDGLKMKCKAILSKYQGKI